MRLRTLFAVTAVAALATACTAVVASTLSERNEFEVPDKCALLEPGVTNQCGACISDRCKQHVEYACQREGTEKKWFSGLKQCAKSPYFKYGEPYKAASYGCSEYDELDAQAISAEDDTAKERAAELCVRDSCIDVADSPCKQCPVRTPKTKGGTEYAELNAEACGKCLVDNCNDVIVRCCSKTVVSTLVEKCAYLANPEYETECRKLAVLPEAGSPDDTKAPEEVVCRYDMSKCYKERCAAACPQ